MGPPTGPAPTDSFAWKDSALDRELRAIKDKKFSDAPEPRSGRDGANDGLDKSLDRWANTPLPKVGNYCRVVGSDPSHFHFTA